jgi:hypothetical protein
MDAWQWERLSFVALLAGFSALVIALWNYEETQGEVAELQGAVRALQQNVDQLEGLSRAQREEFDRRIHQMERDGRVGGDGREMSDDQAGSELAPGGFTDGDADGVRSAREDRSDTS